MGAIPFRLRVRDNTLTTNERGEVGCADCLFRYCVVQSERALTGRWRCLGQRVIIRGSRFAHGQFLIVIADHERA